MPRGLLDGVLEGAITTLVRNFTGADGAPDPGPAAPEPASAPPRPPIEVCEAAPRVTDLALGPQRFTCPCGCEYEVGVTVEPHPGGGVTRTFYVKPCGAAPVAWRRRGAKRRAKR